MAITGIESLVYGVNDVDECVRFFEDFGLVLKERDNASALFELNEGSKVQIRSIDDPALPETVLRDTGVRETIWGVDTVENLEELVRGLETDRKVRRDPDGTVHFHTDCGLALGLRVYNKKKVVYGPDPINAPGHPSRLNNSRKWKTRARPKVITHVVFAVEDFVKTYRFFEERLNFRLSEYQLTFGIYMRCDGANDHHNLFLLDMHKAGAPGYPVFHHANFGVEDIDEIGVGTNYMARKGWTPGMLGHGRHRIASALFSYFKSPTGGEAEYGSDSDYLDDNYVPREWNALFGMQIWMSQQPDWIKNVDIEWHVKHLRDGMPDHIRSKADLPANGKIA
ncbi:VOC family protein [Bradyrhizobium sp. Leo121]|uniref:VOC family protein n=1 Tax=Bradyrhizobium sp. Leo121 TaxID=1571195 RepID=UPI001028CFE0|nr:VOC family protein [Bradyrhizobium sp. Leo121]RZN31446.1 glyoxalase [Bradyrhizobium sp. Leo121]